MDDDEGVPVTWEIDRLHLGAIVGYPKAFEGYGQGLQSLEELDLSEPSRLTALRRVRRQEELRRAHVVARAQPCIASRKRVRPLVSLRSDALGELRPTCVPRGDVARLDLADGRHDLCKVRTAARRVPKGANRLEVEG